MGLSSNARLLSITARITGNEYEAQKLSNSKMRLAVESQSASEEYIKALNSQKLMFQSFNVNGESVDYSLTPSFLYQYADNKNQYLLTNVGGQALVSAEIAENFKSSTSLDDFLAKYELTKKWKTPTLKDNYDKLNSLSSEGGVKDYASAWEERLNEVRSRVYYVCDKGTSEQPEYVVSSNIDYAGFEGVNQDDSNKFWVCDAETAWNYATTQAYNDYVSKYDLYADKKYEYDTAEKDSYVGTENTSGVTKEEVDEYYHNMNDAKYSYMQDYFKYDSWVEMEARTSFSEDYKNYQKYLEVVSEFQSEIDTLGGTEASYEYTDATKARWYTNLWYRLNGESSEKSFAGKNNANYAVLENNLLTSPSWLQDALINGVISIEMASYTETPDIVPDSNYPNVVNLRGISWESKIFSSCVDIVQKDDDAAVNIAQAKYESKMAEIDAKDRKYENQIKSLETEHAALEKEYSSVQDALKNSIKNSFDVFKG